MKVIDNDKELFKDIINYAARLEDVNLYEYDGFMRYFRNLENYIDYISLYKATAGKINN